MIRRLSTRAFPRRLTVLTVAACYVAAYLASQTAPDLTALWVTLLAGAFASLFLLILQTRNLSNRSEREVDERERQVRDRAHRISYWTFSPLVGLLLGAVHSTALDQAANGHVQLALTLRFAPCMTLLAGIALLYLGLPTAIIAWAEPDADDLD